MTDMVRKETLDTTFTFRLKTEEKEEMQRLTDSGETAGDLVREAVLKELARRKRKQQKKR